MDSMRYIPGVTTLKMDENACIGCGICTEVCPHAVFEITGKKAAIRDPDGCMECGACAKNCPSQAIKVNPGVGCAFYIISTWINGEGNGSCGDGSLCC